MKIPGPTLPEKPPNPIPQSLNAFQALMLQMGGSQPLQSCVPGAGLPAGLQPGGMPGTLPNAGLTATLSSDLPGLQGGPPLPGTGLPLGNLPGLPPHLRVPGVIPGNLSAKPTSMGAIDPLATNSESDPIKNLLRQLQSQKQQQQQAQQVILFCY